MTESLQEIFRKGCLIDLNVGMWMAERKLQPEDLGLTKEDLPATFILGHKKLIPASAMAEIRHLEYQARETVTRYSFPFPFGWARFVPRTNLEECTSKLQHLIRCYDDAADKVVSEYDKHRMDMRSEFVTAAHEAYKRRTLLCGGLDQTEDDYVNEFLERINKVYPTPQELRRKYHMDFVVFQVQLPDITRATYEDIAQDADKVRLLREAYTESIRQRVNTFSEQVVAQMRGEATEALSHAAKTFKEGKRLTKATLDVVRKMIDRYESMDLAGDEHFKGKLKEFKTRVLDMYKDKDIISDKGLRTNVTTELECLATMAADEASIRGLVDQYRKELSLV
jgi:hypothetical protein